MAGRTQVIIQGVAWGVSDTTSGRRFLRCSVTPGYRDRNGQWISQPEQNYSVWPAGYANLNPVFDQINQIRQNQDAFVDVTIVGEVNSFHGYTDKQGQPAASCNISASAIAITNVRYRNGSNSQPATPNTQPTATTAPAAPAQAASNTPTDPWASNTASDTEWDAAGSEPSF